MRLARAKSQAHTIHVLRGRRSCAESSSRLAERLHVSRQTINAIETGKYDPSLSLAFNIAKLFDMSIETVFLPDETERKPE